MSSEGMITVGTVRRWEPEALHRAAEAVEKAASSLIQESHKIEGTENALRSRWTGQAGEAALRKLETHRTRGRELAGSLDSASVALTIGARQIASARDTLQRVCDEASARGFTVCDDGSVVSTRPIGAMDVARIARAHPNTDLDQAVKQVKEAADAEAGQIARTVKAQLEAAAQADRALAEALSSLRIPQELQSPIGGRKMRRTLLDDLYNKTDTLRKGQKFGTKLAAFRDFISAARKHGLKGNAGKEAASALASAFGMASAEDVSIITKSAKVAGASKKVLPWVAALSGAKDAITGGGYRGTRGTVTRVLGAAGTVGTAVTTAVSLGALACPPVGIAVAAGAATLYGAWSLGNALYDNHATISKFAAHALTATSNIGNAAAKNLAGHFGAPAPA